MRKVMAVTILMALASGWAEAVDSFKITPEEERMCLPINVKKGQMHADPNWSHMHHYCDCVRFTYRARKALGDQEAIKYNVGVAVNNCEYVLDHTTPNFNMRPMLFFQMGEARYVERNWKEAITLYKKALELNPRLVVAYAKLSDTFKRSGDLAAARSTLEAGLQQDPAAKMLVRRMERLGSATVEQD